MFTVYVIQSTIKDYLYIGYTSNVVERLLRHNGKRERSTKACAPYELVFVKDFKNKSEALKYEKYLKSLKNKKYLFEFLKRERGGSSTG